MDEDSNLRSIRENRDTLTAELCPCWPKSPLLLIIRFYMQQVPEELERVMVGVEAYLSIRKHTLDTGLSFFEDDGEVEKTLNEKV